MELYSYLQHETKRSGESLVFNHNDNHSVSRFFCWYPFRTMYIRADGNVKPCCFYWDESYLGEICNSDVREVWNGEGYREIRKKCIDGAIPDGCRWCIKNSLRP